MTRRYAQLDQAMLADRKFRHLARLLEDRDWYAAVGVYTECVLDSWGEGAQVTAQGPDDLVSALVDVGLLDADQRIPAGTWDKRFTQAVKRQSDRDRQRRHRAAVTGVTERDTQGQDVTAISSNLIGEATSRTNAAGADQGGGLGDQLPPGLAPASLPVLQWLSANVAYVDGMSGLGRMVGEKVSALGADEVIRRLESLKLRGHLDPGDAFGYVVQVTDAYRPSAKAPPDDDIQAALARRRKGATK